MDIYKKAKPSGWYVYAYIREQTSINGPAGSPYYIGQGKKSRAWDKNHNVDLPKNNRFIVIIKDNLTQVFSWILERQLIRWYGRLDTKTGILRNKTDGGPGLDGLVHFSKMDIMYHVHCEDRNRKKSLTRMYLKTKERAQKLKTKNPQNITLKVETLHKTKKKSTVENYYERKAKSCEKMWLKTEKRAQQLKNAKDLRIF